MVNTEINGLGAKNIFDRFRFRQFCLVRHVTTRRCWSAVATQGGSVADDNSADQIKRKIRNMWSEIIICVDINIIHY